MSLARGFPLGTAKTSGGIPPQYKIFAQADVYGIYGQPCNANDEENIARHFARTVTVEWETRRL
jgi:hypothetical protein